MELRDEALMQLIAAFDQLIGDKVKAHMGGGEAGVPAEGGGLASLLGGASGAPGEEMPVEGADALPGEEVMPEGPESALEAPVAEVAPEEDSKSYLRAKLDKKKVDRPPPAQAGMFLGGGSPKGKFGKK